MRNSVSKHFDPILEQDHQYDLNDTAQTVGGFQAGFLLRTVYYEKPEKASIYSTGKSN